MNHHCLASFLLLSTFVGEGYIPQGRGAPGSGRPLAAHRPNKQVLADMVVQRTAKRAVVVCSVDKALVAGATLALNESL